MGFVITAVSLRDLGLEGQMNKQGTPTMGGLIILGAILLPTLLFADLTNVYTQLMVLSTVWLGAIGFLDDYIKVFKKNKEGLAGRFKVIGQVGVGIIVGSITGNSNTIGGGLVYPRADLGDLSGLKQGPGAEMADGKPFFGAKAYKDSKVCNMMTVQEMHRRFHDKTGITFSSLYPGCIAETGLFREKRGWFRSLFPVFMKYVTGGYVSEAEAGDRLAQVVYDPVASKSGVYWSWNGNAQQVGLYDPSSGSVKGAGGSGGEIFENKYSSSTADERTAAEMYEASMKACGLA